MSDGTLRLSELAEAHANGELVCEDGGAEVHLFLKDGQIGWATDSRHPSVFNRHLKENAQVDDESMAAVIAECRNSKASLSETLVAWNLATLEQVQAALRQQIATAVASMERSSPTAKTVFLSRPDHSQVSSRLTFEVREFLGDIPQSAPRVDPPSAGTSEPRGVMPAPAQPSRGQANPSTGITPPPAKVKPERAASGIATAAPATRPETKQRIALVANLPEVRSAVRADLRGVLLDSVRETDAENVAAVMGFLMSTMMRSGAELGLGLLRKLTVTGERTSSLVVVEGDSVLYASVAPPAAITSAEKALDPSAWKGIPSSRSRPS